MKHALICLTAVLAMAAVFSLEGAPAQAPAAAPSPANTAPLRFVDATAASGIKFVHDSGRAGKKLLPETMGAGVVLFDADGDGWLDALFVNSRDWKPGKSRSLQAFYRNNRNGTFTDATKGSGLDVQLYGLGAAAGDYDNDGKVDVYITALEGDRLFRNVSGGGKVKFQDVTAASGAASYAAQSFGCENPAPR